MSEQRNQQKQQGGRGGQQGGGGQKPGQRQQAEVDKKRKRWREIGQKQEERTKSGAKRAWGPATIKPRAAKILLRRGEESFFSPGNGASFCAGSVQTGRAPPNARTIQISKHAPMNPAIR